MSSLPSTYEWAQNADIIGLAKALRRGASLPLIAIGSGGSFTTAAFTADCHEFLCRHVAKAVTPLELGTTTAKKEAGYVILSAGGKNRDILAAFRHLLEVEPVSVVILCTSIGSPLAELASAHSWVDVIEFELPTGKDGFVATNSLLASCSLLARAFAEATGRVVSLPNRLTDLVALPTGTPLDPLPPTLQAALGRDTLLVMHDYTTRAAALDLESKFSEAALGPVQVCDIRSFAHGRHHWLAKRGDSTGILAIHARESSALVHRTTRLLPHTIPLADVVVEDDRIVGALGAIRFALYIAGAAGRLRGIDPGRPGVPPYGSRIYNLSTSKSRKPDLPHGISPRAELAMSRKSGLPLEERRRLGLFDFWRNAHAAFCESLATAAFGGVVFDYDGTLCDAADRFRNLPDDVADRLIDLLSHGIPVGIATGRGGSVREALADRICDPVWQENVLIGYHNGGEIAKLSDGSQPPDSAELSKSLIPVWERLSGDPRTSEFAILRKSAGQITVRPKEGTEEVVWPVVRHYAATHGVPIVRSTHSLDVLAPGVGKHLLVAAMRERLQRSTDCDILVIGDQGEWPGNDYELLTEPYSLSVDRVSPDPSTCWSVLPSGMRGAQGVMWYLAQLRLRKKGFSFKTTSIK